MYFLSGNALKLAPVTFNISFYESNGIFLNFGWVSNVFILGVYREDSVRSTSKATNWCSYFKSPFMSHFYLIFPMW